jgi:aminopeptidase N
MRLWNSSPRLGLGLIAVFALTSCSGNVIHKDDKNKKDLESATSVSATNSSPHFSTLSLTREEALQRFRQIGRVSYSLWFSLGAENSDFLGRTTIRFELKSKAQEYGPVIPIDFEDGTLRAVSINGSPVTDLQNTDRFDGHHIFLKLSELTNHSNKIDISYIHPYSSTGNGLYRFTDPADNRTYVYSNFEPYSAHRLFPCFDQPDLKATYELTVEAPKDWQVISNTLEREKNVIEGQNSWSFPVSPLFSTYLFALHAGPYASWNSGKLRDSGHSAQAEDTEKSDIGKIPTRLFARQSMAKYVDYREWLKVTESGLDFYSTQFGYPYPFAKYDQVIVPDFNAGAMENVGAVTFSERFIYRTKVTVAERRQRAEVILHEMAHMWFGDLVTMRWWNGLWLNESFATFASTWALEKATQFPNIWASFFSHAKRAAYWEDQLVTTHPIDLPVHDTDHAEANFDGITYGKGASVLKQLRFYLGEDDFQEGLQRYFQKFAFHNSTLGDLIHMLSEASNQDLSQWQQHWIQTQGVNTVRANWECKEDLETKKSTLTKFELIQTAPSESTSGTNPNILRTHRTQVALLNFPKTRKTHTALLVAQEPPLNVVYSGALTLVPKALGLPCPDLVFPNYQDQDYAKIELDPISLTQVQKNLNKVSDPLTRQMIWHTLWEMVVDGKLRPQDYADAALKGLTLETNPEIISSTLEHLADSSANTNSILKFLEGPLRKSYHAQLELFIRSRLIAAAPGSNEQLLWYRSALQIASSPHSKNFFSDLLTHKQKLSGIQIDQTRRWQILEVLARMGTSDIADLIEKELKGDNTDIGQKNAVSAQVLIPTAESKSRWLNRILKKPGTQGTPSESSSSVGSSSESSSSQSAPVENFNKTLSFATLRAAMSNYTVLGQEEFTKSLMPIYFEELPKLATSGAGTEYAKTFGKTMYPSLCDPEVVARTSKLLEEYPNLPAGIIKTLKAKRQEESRCIQVRKNSLTPKAD